MTFQNLQEHTLSRALDLPPRVRDLKRELVAVLRRASDDRRLITSPQEILRQVRILDEPPPSLRAQLRERELEADAFCVVGGEKNQNRLETLEHFKRDDGAWFDFSIVVRQEQRALVLLAYDFEIRFPPGRGAPFLRFDLNLPGHDNESDALRAHCHPGFEELLVPAPKMSPTELLDMFVNAVRLPTDRAPRELTQFELDWYTTTANGGA